MESLKEKIEACLHLLLNGQPAHHPYEIYSTIKALLEKHIQATTDSTLTPILYNATYGSFGYAPEFKQFLTEQRGTSSEALDNDRLLYKGIVEFGHFVMKQADPDISYHYFRNFYKISTLYKRNWCPPQNSTWKNIWKEELHPNEQLISTSMDELWEKVLDFITTEEGHRKDQNQLSLAPMRCSDGQWFDPILKKNRPVRGATLEKVAERLGLQAASSRYCSLKVAWIPKNRSYRISEYDGEESVQIGSVLHDKDHATGPHRVSLFLR
jgi:hypothetical protein